MELSIESSTAAGGEIIKPSGPHVKIPESLKLSNEAYTTYKVCNNQQQQIKMQKQLLMNFYFYVLNVKFFSRICAT